MSFSNKEADGGSEETCPRDVAQLGELLVSPEEGHAVDVSIVLDLPHNLVDEECLHCVVELVLVKVRANIAEEVVGPVSMLNAMEETVVLGHLQTGFEVLQVHNGIKGVSGGIQGSKPVSVIATVLLFGQVLYSYYLIKSFLP